MKRSTREERVMMAVSVSIHDILKIHAALLKTTVRDLVEEALREKLEKLDRERGDGKRICGNKLIWKR